MRQFPTRPAARSIRRLLFLSIGLSTDVLASPLETPDIEAAEDLELRILLSYSGSATEWAGAGPTIDIALPLTDRLELSGTAGYLRAGGRGADTLAGLSAAAFAVKWEAIPLSDRRSLGLAFEPGLTVPSGSRRLGQDVWSATLPITLGWQGKRLSGRASIAIDVPLTGGGKPETFVGAAVAYDLSNGTRLSVELVNRSPCACIRGDNTDLNIGIEWPVSRSLTLLARVGTGFDQFEGPKRMNGLIGIQRSF